MNQNYHLIMPNSNIIKLRHRFNTFKKSYFGEHLTKFAIFMCSYFLLSSHSSFRKQALN